MFNKIKKPPSESESQQLTSSEEINADIDEELFLSKKVLIVVTHVILATLSGVIVGCGTWGSLTYLLYMKSITQDFFGGNYLLSTMAIFAGMILLSCFYYYNILLAKDIINRKLFLNRFDKEMYLNILCTVSGICFAPLTTVILNVKFFS